MNSRFLATLAALILLFFLTCWIYCNFCVDSCGEGCCSTANTSVEHSTFSFKDNDVDLHENIHLAFLKDSDKPIIPAPIVEHLDSIVRYFKMHPEKRLTINGFAASDENGSALGAARAEAIKQYLSSRGMSDANIDIVGDKLAGLKMDGADTIYGPITFGVTANEKPTAEGPKTIFSPRTVYFASGRNSIVETEELKTYFAEADKYLDEHPESKLNVIGYTDEIGEANSNQRLSESRAGFVARSLGKYGISIDRIKVGGEGENNPIDDNKTSEGRAKNRRVEITLGN